MDTSEGSEFATLETLVQCLEQLVIQESAATQQTWVTVSRLQVCFQEQYHRSLHQVLESLSQTTLRQVLVSSRILAIYQTASKDDFYVAYRPSVNPYLSHPVRTYEHQSCDVSTQRTDEASLPTEIASAADLEHAIAEIVSTLAISTTDGVVPLNLLAQSFYALVGEPLRPTLRRICPATRLRTFLQNCTQLSVQEQDGVVYITRNK